MSLGLLLLLIFIVGFLSHFLNYKFLDQFFFIRWLYYLGAFVHEISHALFCFLGGAKIEKIKIFSSAPYVIHKKSKIPVLGEVLIALAPLLGGIVFLFFISKFLKGEYFYTDIQEINLTFAGFLDLLKQILLYLNLKSWQGWVLFFLILNAGRMLGPSFQDLKNIWLPVILLLFVKNDFIAKFLFLVLALITINILFQIITIIFLSIFSFLKKR
jgi:hypothetical protein